MVIQETTSKGEWASQDFSASAGSNEISVYVYGDSVKDIEPVVKDLQKKMEDKGDYTHAFSIVVSKG